MISINSSKLKLKDIILEVANNLDFGKGLNDSVIILTKENDTNYVEEELEELNSQQILEQYLDQGDTNAIFIPFALYNNIEEEIVFANGNSVNMYDFDIGSIELYDDTIVGMILWKENSEYYCEIGEFDGNGRAKISKNYGDFKEIVENFLEEYIE